MSLLGSLVRGTVLRLTGTSLRAELAQVTRQLDRLRNRLERAGEETGDLRKRLAANRRHAKSMQPDERVLEQVLPLRHAAIIASNHDGRAQREAAFIARSVSYRDALAMIAPPPDPGSRIPPVRRSPQGEGGNRGADHVTAGGLSWCLPNLDEAGALTQRVVAGHRLPLDEILEARELAVGRAMIDIGANVGTTSIPRVVLGDFACVYAAEPDPANYACLVRNIVDNQVRGLVLPDRVAIGDVDGEMTMRVQASGTHHLLTDASHTAEHERVAVPSLTLDTWIDRIGIDLSEVSFIKSDTQGWDARVLAGAPRVLEHKHIAWQIEFSPAMLQRAGWTPEQVYQLLHRHFTHFIDLRGQDGVRARRTSALHEALAYVVRGERRYTNVLLYTSA